MAGTSAQAPTAAATGASRAAALKQQARQALLAARPELVALSHRIHGHPELAFDEHRAAAWLAAALEAHGFRVTRGVAGLSTAFDATWGSGDLVVGLCAEYDALPEIGHACGHNLIAAAAVGAAVALAPVADRAGLTVRVLGTPAEEQGGGKVLMLERGAFTGVHLAMLVHPGPTAADVVSCRALACSQITVEFRGRAAHAGAHPDRGLNAGDAATIAQVAIGLVRQHLMPRDRVHGIVTSGGTAANVIPDRVTMRYLLRSDSLARLGALEERVTACLQAGALGSGCTVTVAHDEPGYSHFEGDRDLESFYRANLLAMGRPPGPDPSEPPGYSTDMGNVSLALPAIQPTVGIGTGAVVNHQAEFAAHCIGSAADDALLRGAQALSWTSIDAALTDKTRGRLRAGIRRP